MLPMTVLLFASAESGLQSERSLVREEFAVPARCVIAQIGWSESLNGGKSARISILKSGSSS
jgi:hypothetical protein